MPTKLLFGSLLLIYMAILMACTSGLNKAESPINEDDTLYQTSTLSALIAGDYDGDLTIAELKNHGDFGLGTFNALDGEMIVADGEVYQARPDGVAYLAGDSVQTPFAIVTNFTADQSFTISDSLTCAQLQDELDNLLPVGDAPYALKIDGEFSTLKTRAPHKQSQPYLPLADALADQAVFDSQNITGTMIGFRLPEYMEGINAVGYHFHFLTADRQAGGHVLDCQVQNVEVEIDTIDEVQLDLS